jgi:hypothetical protein
MCHTAVGDRGVVGAERGCGMIMWRNLLQLLLPHRAWPDVSLFEAACVSLSLSGRGALCLWWICAG